VISFFGTSAGKAIAGLRVQTTDREKLSLEIALRRNLLLYVKGFFLGVPLLILAGYIKSYQDMRERGFTTWDEDTGSRVFAENLGEWRIFLIGTLAIGAMLLDRVLALRA
jgi:uncharacterized RDD family membrane protein YckC